MNGTGNFIFTDAIGRTITVWYACPAEMNAQTPVVFVMHGVKRNGEEYRDSWVAHARAKNFLLLVPEFSQAQFPGEERYNYGDLYADSGELNDPAQWAFTSIEKIFDQVTHVANLNATTYRLYGHSAGAQFAHRFVFFTPRARLAQAAIANAGWYTLPRDDLAFPYGLRNAPITRAQLRAVFAKPVTILLGEADTDPNAPSLRNTPEAQAQGAHRLERGKNFFATAQQHAATLGATFNWQLAFAPNIGHSNPGMATFAADLLFPV